MFLQREAAEVGDFNNYCEQFFGVMESFLTITTIQPWPLIKSNSIKDLICSCKDSFITQDRNEQIKGVKVEATFSSGHISLIWGPNSKKLAPNERYGCCVSVDTWWVAVGWLVRSLQPYKVGHFFKIFKIAEKWAFFLIAEN